MAFIRRSANFTLSVGHRAHVFFFFLNYDSFKIEMFFSICVDIWRQTYWCVSLFVQKFTLLSR